VLLFGDDYQLFPVIEEGAIQAYSKKKLKVPQTPTAKTSASQLLCQRGSYLFTHVMSETVFTLDKNYRVKTRSSVTSLVGYAQENQQNKMQT
jgi:hypothetical protein